MKKVDIFVYDFPCEDKTKLKYWSSSLTKKALLEFTGKEPVLLKRENGKPYCLEGPFFNVSHSFDCFVIAISWQLELGIDLEKRRDNVNTDLIKKRFFTEDEFKCDFFDVWCQKEALLKYLGKGIFMKDLKNCLQQNKDLILTRLNIKNSFSCFLCTKEEPLIEVHYLENSTLALNLQCL